MVKHPPPPFFLCATDNFLGDKLEAIIGIVLSNSSFVHIMSITMQPSVLTVRCPIKWDDSEANGVGLNGLNRGVYSDAL